MPQNWKTYKLIELCTHVVDCPHSTPKWTDIGVFVLRSNNIRNGKLNYTKVSYTDSENYQKRVKRAIPQGGDLIITREAPMGEVCMLPEGIECCMGQRMVLLRPNTTMVENAFLLYVLQSRFVQTQIQAYEGTGSTVSNLRIPVLEGLTIPYPPLREQKAIASILSAIDDKIENNLAMNKTLEEMAMALYKHWFVDFAPFQDQEFIDSELGSIPKGWEVKTVGDAVKVVGGYAFKSKDFQESGEAVIKIKNIGGNLVALDGSSFIPHSVAEKTNSKFEIEPASFLIAMTGAEVGKVGIVPDYKRRLWLNQRVGMITNPKFKSADVLIGNFLQSTEGYEIIQNLAYGSAQPNISTTGIESVELALPAEISILENTLRQMTLWHQQKVSLRNENLTLTQLRDTLLPKLISGEVRVKDVEQTVANAL